MRDSHLNGAPSWDQPGVEANVASNPHCILQIPLHLQQQSEQLCQLPLNLPYCELAPLTLLLFKESYEGDVSHTITGRVGVKYKGSRTVIRLQPCYFFLWDGK